MEDCEDNKEHEETIICFNFSFLKDSELDSHAYMYTASL